MAEKIKLVQGDSLPYINLTLTDDSTGAALNLSDPETVVRVYFRASGSTTILSTIVCYKVNGGADGKVRFDLSSVSTVPSGLYEAEVEIDFDGLSQTVYETLKIFLRPQFA